MISAVYCCISIIEKRETVTDQMTKKGHGPDKMTWWAVGCRSPRVDDSQYRHCDSN